MKSIKKSLILKTHFKMGAIKLLFIVFCVPLLINAQKTKFPKDTIYLNYTDTIFSNKKMKAKSQHTFNNEAGIKFWWNGKWMFYNYKSKPDTLPISRLKDYKTLNLKEVRKKEIDWVDRKFAKSKYKPYSGSKNAVFHTFLIEVISKDKFVIYPVIWRNEGIID